MLEVQHESISDLKKMIAFLLEKQKKKKKSSRPGASSSKSKGKEKMGANSTIKNTDGEKIFEYEVPKFHLKIKIILKTKIIMSIG